MTQRIRLLCPLSLILFLGILAGCTPSRTATSQPDTASPTATPPALLTVPARISPTPMGPLVVTVLATDVALKQAPDDRSPSVGATFTVNGRAISTVLTVSGELPVLETDVAGADGRTRWTRVRYQGRVGPLDGGTDLDTTGYLRNDLVSAPHAPGASPARNPTARP